MTVKFNHDKNVLSLAKKTLGSTRAGNAILLLWDMVRKEVVSLAFFFFKTSMKVIRVGAPALMPITRG